MNSIELIEMAGNSAFKNQSNLGQYSWNYREQDAARWASYYGISFIEPRGRVSFDSNLLALAATASIYFDSVEPFTIELFKLMFSDASIKVIDMNACINTAVKLGIDSAKYKSKLESTETSLLLESNIESALNIGLFGVPTFAHCRDLFWGNE